MKYIKKFNENYLKESEDHSLIPADPDLERRILEKLKEWAQLYGYYDEPAETQVWSDGSIDVQGNVYFWGPKPGSKLPFKFRNITGEFSMESLDLTNLVGCPENVGSSGGETYFTIADFPKLKSLEGGPKVVYGEYIINDCPSLTSLKGLPESVDDLSIGKTGFTSLEGLPKRIDGMLHLHLNSKLWDPKGLEDVIISGHLYMSGSPLCSIAVHFGVKDQEGIGYRTTEYVGNFIRSLDYKYVVNDGGVWKVIKWRFAQALDELDLPMPSSIPNYPWID